MKTFFSVLSTVTIACCFSLPIAFAQDEDLGLKGDGGDAIVRTAEIVVTEDGAPVEEVGKPKKDKEKSAIDETKKDTPVDEKKEETAAEVSEQKGDTSEKKTTTLFKTVNGRVSGISKNFIAVEYARDDANHSSQEVPLEIGPAPVLEHVQEVTEIKEGDTVSVQYAEYMEIGDDGKELVVKREAKIIKFVSPAQPIPAEVVVEEPAPEETGEAQAT